MFASKVGSWFQVCINQWHHIERSKKFGIPPYQKRFDVPNARRFSGPHQERIFSTVLSGSGRSYFARNIASGRPLAISSGQSGDSVGRARYDPFPTFAVSLEFSLSSRFEKKNEEDRPRPNNLDIRESRGYRWDRLFGSRASSE